MVLTQQCSIKETPAQDQPHPWFLTRINLVLQSQRFFLVNLFLDDLGVFDFLEVFVVYFCLFCSLFLFFVLLLLF